MSRTSDRNWNWSRGLLATLGAMLAAISLSLAFSVHAPIDPGDAMVYAYICGPLCWIGLILHAATTARVGRSWAVYGGVALAGCALAFGPLFVS